MKKLLLHTCCGPCFLGAYEGLKDLDLKITNYYYNPNIQPKEEWEKRLKNLELALKNPSDGLLVEPYDTRQYQDAISGKEDDFPVRCLDCYRLRLQKTAEVAKEGGFDLFSTTLLISPYQQHERLKEIGQQVAEMVGIDFLYIDLRPYFRDGQDIAKEECIYRQKYCGCLYSLDEK